MTTNENPRDIVATAADSYFLGGDRFHRDRDFAGNGSIQHGLHYNREATRSQSECNRTIFSQGLDGIHAQFEGAERSRQFTAIAENQFRMELRLGDSQQETRQLINDNARDQDKANADLKEKIAVVAAGQVLLGNKIDTNAELAGKDAEIVALAAKLDNREQTISNYCCPKPAQCVDQCCGGGGSGGSNDTQVILHSQAQQFQALQQTMTAGLGMIADAIKTINTGNGNGNGNPHRAASE